MCSGTLQEICIPICTPEKGNPKLAAELSSVLVSKKMVDAV